MLTIHNATSLNDLLIIEKLSQEIFHEHYDTYMDEDHVDFFLQKYMSIHALSQQVEEGYLHYLLKSGETPIGFLSLLPSPTKMLLSKLYVHQQYRGLKIGKKALDFTINLAQSKALKVLELIVNQNNHRGINFYKREGFNIEKAVRHHFENGHSEDDYLMRLEL
ncbi:MAG: GNAT family N-acetyltransferase [Flavobacteriales bacterium]|nr:GNAT family N-acetyltransferase [Flavobacteriales bacterium]